MPIARVTIRMEYATDRNASSVVQWKHETRFLLDLVPGEVFGDPSVTLHDLMGNLSQFTLNFAAMTAGAGTYAEPLTPEALASGLRLEPAEARIARVATRTYELRRAFRSSKAFTWTAIGATGFIAPTDRWPLILVYVDRPCRLYGTVPMSYSQSTEVDAQMQVVEDPVHPRLGVAPAMTAVTHLTRIDR